MKPIERRAKTGRSTAFTLLELLLSVAVIAVLLAILFPAYRSARAVSQTAQCVQNLKTIYIATLNFVNDYDGLLPPDLGMPEAAVIHPRYSVNQFWWDGAYLGRYVLNDLNRRRDSVGRLKGHELVSFQCPSRLPGEPDSEWTDHPVTYVMQKLFTNRPRNYRFRTMENRAEKLFLTEGRFSTLVAQNAKTGEHGDRAKRLRRYHGNGLNILFFDGRVQKFTGSDEEIVPFIKSGD